MDLYLYAYPYVVLYAELYVDSFVDSYMDSYVDPYPDSYVNSWADLAAVDVALDSSDVDLLELHREHRWIVQSRSEFVVMISCYSI